ncbi:MAG: FAD-binding oxidoreductase, partial [Chloroflexus sp.]|nr:FAD-binding oxidoreductase [Chloroflexus sp.]
QAEALRGEAHVRLWEAINNLPQTASVAADELVVRITCLPAALSRVLAAARDVAQRAAVSLQAVARAINGIAYLRVHGSVSQLHEWHTAVLQVAPQTVLLAAPTSLVSEVPAFGTQIANLEVMQRIKQEFDPENLLNPGRFVV